MYYVMLFTPFGGAERSECFADYLKAQARVASLRRAGYRAACYPV